MVAQSYFDRVKAFPPHLRGAGLLSFAKDPLSSPTNAGVPPWGRFFSFEKWITYNYDEAGVLSEFALSYEASMAFADDMFGKIWTKYTNTSLKNSTIVYLWSDHGFALGEKGHLWKHALWERTTHAQLMVHMPGLNKHIAGHDAEHQRVDVNTPVSLMDMYPTICDMAGIATPPHIKHMRDDNWRRTGR